MMSELLEHYGPCAVIAGASEGIGAAFARTLGEAGFDLVLIARRAAPLSALADELRARHGCNVDTIELDLAAHDLESQLEHIAREREVGLVVYNAALSIVAPFLDTPLADKLRILDVNARGPLIAAHVFGSRMAARGGGGIILLSSLTAFWGSAWVATYGATKAFDLSLGEALAHELGERGVDVLVSCAGATRTPGFVQMMTGRKAPRAMSPASVVRETLGALSRRGAFVPGTANRLVQQVLSRALPRSWAIRVMASQTRSLL
jgi:short-subunit dehydrogenase